jgi:hypothetical protein
MVSSHTTFHTLALLTGARTPTTPEDQYVKNIADILTHQSNLTPSQNLLCMHLLRNIRDAYQKATEKELSDIVLIFKKKINLSFY